MNHKKFHKIRWISMICVFTIIVLILCRIVIGIYSGEHILSGKLIYILLGAGIFMLSFFIFFGRIFCGFLCPLGFFQDVIWKVTEKLHLTKFSRNEKFMKFINIINRIFLIFFICGMVTLTGILIFSREIFSKIRISIAVPIIIVVFMITLNLFARRFFCNVCPIGSFIGLFKKFNLVKLEKNCDSCTMCGACYEACPMRIKSVYTEKEKEKENISSVECLYCGECIRKCSEDHTLAFTFCGREIYKSSRSDFINNQFSNLTDNKKDEK